MPGRPNPPANWAGVKPRGNFKQRQRVAVHLGDDPVPHPLVPTARAADSSSALASRLPWPRTAISGSPESSDTSLGSRSANAAATRSAHSRPAPRSREPAPKRDRATGRRPRCRPERAARPLPIGGSRRPDRPESFPGRPPLPDQRDPCRIALGDRQMVKAVQQRSAQLMHTSERQLPSPTRPRSLAQSENPLLARPKTSTRPFPTPDSPRSTSTPL